MMSIAGCSGIKQGPDMDGTHIELECLKSIKNSSISKNLPLAADKHVKYLQLDTYQTGSNNSKVIELMHDNKEVLKNNKALKPKKSKKVTDDFFSSFQLLSENYLWWGVFIFAAIIAVLVYAKGGI